LIGDPDQLPSVDAGQVLTDLIAAAGGAGWTARLTRSFRVDTDDAGGRAILAAAAAVLAGDARKLTAGRDRLAHARGSAAEITGRGVEVIDADPTAALAYVDAWWTRRWQVLGDLARRSYHRTDGRWHTGDETALSALLAGHEASRLLAVTRTGPLGAIAIGQRCHARVLAEATVDGAPEFLPGDPVVQTRNDYARGLWNGDQGVVARVVDDDGAQHYRVVFRRGDDLVPFPVDALRGGIELGWAMTVHKSQGSELGQVTLLLPPDDLPLVSRELVYTALTRARTSAVIVGASAILVAGGARRALRSTGLAARLAPRAK
jgi:exodeoxyribonuclease V alpha subunit